MMAPTTANETSSAILIFGLTGDSGLSAFCPVVHCMPLSGLKFLDFTIPVSFSLLLTALPFCLNTWPCDVTGKIPQFHHFLNCLIPL